MLTRILVGLGGTPYTASEVQHALDLARAHNAEVTAATIVDLGRVANVGPIPAGAGAAAADLVRHRLNLTDKAIDDAVAHFEHACSAAGVKGHVIREAGDPFEELIGLWRYHDLTILSLRSLFEYGVVRDPKDMLVQLIARGVRPILAVATQPRTVNRVLIAYNGSMESAKAMKQFVMMRLWPEATLQILCAELPADEARPLLNDAAAYCAAHRFNVETIHRGDEAGPALLDQAALWNADLIVLGATARARIFRHILGDTALHLVKHSELPLFMTQ